MKIMNNIVFLGVGGTGLSAVAGLLSELGFSNIIGIDSNESQITKKLTDKGLQIVIGHGKYKPNKNDLIIYSDIEAIKNGPEMQEFLSLERGLKRRPPLSYSQFIGEISKWFKTIAVAGSKGKSSTTAMTIYAMNQSVDFFGLGIVGGFLPDFDNKNYVINPKRISEIKDIFSYFLTGRGVLNYENIKKFFFVIEACEYKNHFLLYDVDYSIITNFYYDHFDFFPTYEEYIDSYLSLIKNTKKKVFFINYELGITNYDLFSNIEGKQYFLEKIQKKGFFDKINFVERDYFKFDYIFGDHWNINASLVVSITDYELGIANEKTSKPTGSPAGSVVREGLPVRQTGRKAFFQDFHGVWRRMEKIGENKYGLDVYSDYGHTAQSVGTGIKSLQKHFPQDEILIIFQPHQMRRILEQWEEFQLIMKNEKGKMKSEKGKVSLIIYKLYTAREKLSDFDFGQFSFLGKDNFESFDEIGELFAVKCGGKYETDTQKIFEKINNFKSGKIVLFTAGDLDYDVRGRLQKI